MSEVEDAKAFEEARTNEALYIDQESVGWSEERGGLRAILSVTGGMPVGADVRVIFQLSQELQPQNLSVLWGDTRVRGMDLSGAAHQNTRGRRVPTPHQQFFRNDGVYETEPFVPAQLGIIDCPSALRQFLQWCGITSNHRWNDPPPMQRALPGSKARMQKTRRSKQ